MEHSRTGRSVKLTKHVVHGNNSTFSLNGAPENAMSRDGMSNSWKPFLTRDTMSCTCTSNNNRNSGVVAQRLCIQQTSSRPTHLFNVFTERLVQQLATSALLGFLFQFVRIVHGLAAIIQRLRRVHDFRVELNFVRLFLADHQRLLQVEMKENFMLLVTRLEDGVLDVAVNDVKLFALVAQEPKAV
jgi:hypothetical protein